MVLSIIYEEIIMCTPNTNCTDVAHIRTLYQYSTSLFPYISYQKCASKTKLVENVVLFSKGSALLLQKIPTRKMLGDNESPKPS